MSEAGWRQVAVHPIGGLTEVGFLADSSLLVASHQGRGEYDLESGALLARDSNEDSTTWFDPTGPSCLAVSSRDWVPVAGLAGGALPTASGRWRIEIHGEEAVAVADDGSMQQLSDGEEIRVVGFSSNGAVIVVGRPMDVTIFRH